MSHKAVLNVQLILNKKSGAFKDEASVIKWIEGCLNCNTNHVEATVSISPPVTVVVDLDGGLVQNVTADGAATVLVVDFDIEGTTDDIVEIYGEEAIVSRHNPVPVNAQYIGDVNMALDAVVPAASSNQPNPFDQWEGDVKTRLTELLDVTHSDAQGIVEAQRFLMQQSWTGGLTPGDAAKVIVGGTVPADDEGNQ